MTAQIAFKLSDRSRKILAEAHPDIIKVIELAIEITSVDFGVTCARRTEAEQKLLIGKGASWTMDSKHLKNPAEAVDLVAYIGSRVSWEFPLYHEIAEAVREAAIECEVPIRWGGAWNVRDIRKWTGSMAQAMDFYVDERRKSGAKINFDGPHFELSTPVA